MIGPAIDARLALRRNAHADFRGRESAGIASGIQEPVAKEIVVEDSVDVCPPNASRRRNGAISNCLLFALPQDVRKGFGAVFVVCLAHMNLVTAERGRAGN